MSDVRAEPIEFNPCRPVILRPRVSKLHYTAGTIERAVQGLKESFVSVGESLDEKNVTVTPTNGGYVAAGRPA